jgi:alpha-tubulin suppressor-like RCC1 family protein
MVLTNCGKVFTWGKGDRDMRVNASDFFNPMNNFEHQRFKGLDLYFTNIACGATHLAAVTSS